MWSLHDDLGMSDVGFGWQLVRKSKPANQLILVFDPSSSDRTELAKDGKTNYHVSRRGVIPA